MHSGKIAKKRFDKLISFIKKKHQPFGSGNDVVQRKIVFFTAFHNPLNEFFQL